MVGEGAELFRMTRSPWPIETILEADFSDLEIVSAVVGDTILPDEIPSEV